MQQLDGGLRIGTFSAGFQPASRVVENWVGSLEMLQYEVRLRGTFLDQILAAPVRILQEQSLNKRLVSGAWEYCLLIQQPE